MTELPEGYRLLQVGEAVQAKDEMYSWAPPDFSRKDWLPFEAEHVEGVNWHVHEKDPPIRRRND